MPLRSPRVGDFLSRGSELLFAELERTGLSQNAFARRVGIDAAAVTRLLHGDRRPGFVIAEKFRLAARIPMGAWHEPPSKKFRRKFIAAAV